LTDSKRSRPIGVRKNRWGTSAKGFLVKFKRGEQNNLEGARGSQLAKTQATSTRRSSRRKLGGLNHPGRRKVCGNTKGGVGFCLEQPTRSRDEMPPPRGGVFNFTERKRGTY